MLRDECGGCRGWRHGRTESQWLACHAMRKSRREEFECQHSKRSRRWSCRITLATSHLTSSATYRCVLRPHHLAGECSRVSIDVLVTAHPGLIAASTPRLGSGGVLAQVDPLRRPQPPHQPQPPLAPAMSVLLPLPRPTLTTAAPGRSGRPLRERMLCSAHQLRNEDRRPCGVMARPSEPGKVEPRSALGTAWPYGPPRSPPRVANGLGCPMRRTDRVQYLEQQPERRYAL